MSLHKFYQRTLVLAMIVAGVLDPIASQQTDSAPPCLRDRGGASKSVPLSLRSVHHRSNDYSETMKFPKTRFSLMEPNRFDSYVGQMRSISAMDCPGLNQDDGQFFAAIMDHPGSLAGRRRC